MTAVLSAPIATGDVVQRPRLVTRRHEDARDSLRRFVRGRVDDTVVVTRDLADAIGLAAHIAPGDVVVLSSGDGRDAAWPAGPQGRDRARVVPVGESVEDTLFVLESELAAHPVCLLAVMTTSAGTGEVLPVGRLASIAHRHGARIFVDAERLVAHRPISIVSHGIDYVAFSAAGRGRASSYGVLIGRSDWFAGAGSGASGPNVTGAGSGASGPNVTGAGSGASGPNVAGAGSGASGPDLADAAGINGCLKALTPPTARTPDHRTPDHRRPEHRATDRHRLDHTDPTSTRGNR
ncbi:aminotransferase class V-fold PLP-dependent enzyme [Gordonia sp. 'Campus']|uniref:aminotransferase class V-fold PLP-dependent enzyme n=1 Tax=Gordonia sp. 'Campus' TaxID=2915824 RepID=UPI001EE4520D|nr:aminotransferase class V-fold PLP-dependent enzyme [Gordonia sp. 'Campus']